VECRRGLAMRILSVHPSVSLSVKCVHVTKREKDLSRFLYLTKDDLAYFLRTRIVDRGDPFYLKFWVNRPTRWSEIADFEPIFARSASLNI